MKSHSPVAVVSFLLLAALATLAPSAAPAQPIEAGPWFGLGPEGARVEELSAGPAGPSGSGVVWAAVADGGVFRSTNGGATWRPAYGGLEATAVLDVAADPSDAEKAFAAAGLGLLVTTDGGASWSPVELPGRPPQGPRTVERVAVAPSDPDTVYAAAGALFWRSADGGVTWSRGGDLPAGGTRVIEVDPDQPGTVVAAVFRGGILVSTDGGATWGRFDDFNGSAESFAFAPSDPGTIYAGVDRGANRIGVFKTEDGGATWAHVGERFTGQVAWDTPEALAVDPSDADAVVAGGSWGLFRTTDGGGDWNRAPIPATPLGPRHVLSAEWLPGSGGTVLVGTERGGVLRSTDGGATWSESNGGLDARSLGLQPFLGRPGGVDRRHPGLVADPRANGRLYAVTRDFRLYATEDWGSTWRRVDTVFDPGNEGPGRGVVVDFRLIPTRPDVLFARVYFQPTPTEPMLEALYRSRDAGRTWTRVGEGLPRTGLDPFRTLGDLHWDPQAANALYVQLGGTVYRSRDDGGTWNVFLDDLPTPTDGRVHVTTLAPAPGGNTLFGWADVTGEDTCTIGFCPPPPLVRRLFKSTNGGRSWTELAAANDAFAGNSSQFVDDANPSIWYATIDGDLHRSTNGGASFSFYFRTPYEPLGSRPRDGWPKGGSRPEDELPDPVLPDVVYRALRTGSVERSTDGGETWQDFAAGLVPHSVGGLVLVPHPGTAGAGGPRVLLAVTDAGVWARRLDGGVFPPPPGEPFVTSEFPDFRFWFRISAGAGAVSPVRRETDCLPETLCVSGAVPGRIEVLARIVGPKPNGFLWPTLVKFTTSEVEVWIERVSTGETRHYRLRGASPGVDELPGLFDRDGFPFNRPPV